MKQRIKRSGLAMAAAALLFMAAAGPVHAEEAQTYGWKKEGKYWYYYSEKTGKPVKNTIAGDKKGGYYYVDNKGIRVNDAVTNLAVKFVRANTKESWSDAKKLKTCVNVLVKKHKYAQIESNKASSKAKASSMKKYAKRFFTKKSGNCYCHAASVAYVAKVIGYKNVKVGKGSLHNLKYKTITPHGWCEVKRPTKVYIYDLTMGRRNQSWPLIGVLKNKSVFFNKKLSRKYRYNLTGKKYFTLNAANGKMVWK